MSLKERKTIKESDNQIKFKEKFDELLQKNYLPEFLP